MTFKNIRIKMKGGKTRTQRVKVLASGKYKFVKNIKSKRSTTKSRKSTPKRSKSKSASRKGGNRMGNKGGKSITHSITTFPRSRFAFRLLRGRFPTFCS